MRVIRAEVMGLCFGVRDALEVVDAIDEPSTVTIHGQLVHNEVVQGRLAARGFAMREERDRGSTPPGTAAVLVTAHGISDRERGRLEAQGKRIIDTTCPLVARVHQAARVLQADGYHVVVIGRKGHVEVEGIVGDLDDPEVVESVEEVAVYPHRRLGIVCQTTMTEDRVARIRAAIVALNPDAEITFVDTVCLPTKEHQRSLDRLLDRVEAVVVVGGRNSNNTRELAARCRDRGKPAVHVQSADELDPARFKGFATVGLTAGTSTLAETIEEVHRALVWIGSGPDRSGLDGACGTPEPPAFLGLEAEVSS
jgi:4-hydroxy-3-methylbut-2-enyl diphosphate reductase